MMALSEFETKKIEKALAALMEKRRPQVSIRSKLDLGYRISGQSVELFEIRPRYDKPEIILEHAFAKTTYVNTQRVWKVFWMRADLKWHGYKPNPEVCSFEEFLDLVDRDEYGCFRG
jgi:hypothetical protein